MVRVHTSRVLVQRHQEDVLLLVRSVEGQDAHHDEVRDDRRSGETNTPASPTDHQVISFPEWLDPLTNLKNCASIYQWLLKVLQREKKKSCGPKNYFPIKHNTKS